MARHYLIVSDLHLSDFEDHADGWMAHKHPRYAFDQDFAQLLERFCSRRKEGDELCLVLNGDVLDFDLLMAHPADPVWPLSASEKSWGLLSSAPKSAWKAKRILHEHPIFLQALAQFLDQGHEIVYVFGNHDRELHFPEVQAELLTALDALRAPAGHPDEQPTKPRQQVRFEPWFYFVPGQIFVEHGQQYSYYTSFEDPLCPTIDSPQGPVLALPMGNLSNRYLMTKMGFFNPFASDFILNFFAYGWHWLRFYAFSRRSLAFSWFWGSLVVMGHLLSIKRAQLRQRASCPPQAQALTNENYGEKPIGRLQEIERHAERYQLSPQLLEQLLALQQAPITNRFFRVVREFWLDRLALFGLMVGGTIALALLPIPLWVKWMTPLTVFPLLFVLYETMAHGDSIFSIEGEMPRVAREIARLLPVKVVAMGHDHVPRVLPLGGDVLFADTGTWAPIYHPKSGELSPGFRNYLVLRFEDGELLDLQFGCCTPLGGAPR